MRRIVGRLRSADAGTVRQVRAAAESLPLDVFLEIADLVEERKRTGVVANDAGLLVSQLKIAAAERRAGDEQVFFAPPVAWKRLEPWLAVVKREQPRAYVRAMANQLDDEAIAEALGGRWDGELRELAASVRAGVEAEAPLPESPLAVRLRWIDEHGLALPEADVRRVIDGWDDVDGTERGVLHDNAKALRAAASLSASGRVAA